MNPCFFRCRAGAGPDAQRAGPGAERGGAGCGAGGYAWRGLAGTQGAGWLARRARAGWYAWRGLAGTHGAGGKAHCVSCVDVLPDRERAASGARWRSAGPAVAYRACAERAQGAGRKAQRIPRRQKCRACAARCRVRRAMRGVRRFAACGAQTCAQEFRQACCVPCRHGVGAVPQG